MAKKTTKKTAAKKTSKKTAAKKTVATAGPQWQGKGFKGLPKKRYWGFGSVVPSHLASMTVKYTKGQKSWEITMPVNAPVGCAVWPPEVDGFKIAK